MSALRRFSRDASGLAAVEAALLAPVALGLLGLVVFGGEGLSIQRKLRDADLRSLIMSFLRTRYSFRA